MCQYWEWTWKKRCFSGAITSIKAWVGYSGQLTQLMMMYMLIWQVSGDAETSSVKLFKGVVSTAADCTMSAAIKCANITRLNNYSQVHPRCCRQSKGHMRKKKHPPQQQKENGHLKATSEIRSHLISVRTHQAGYLQHLPHPLSLSHMSMPSEHSFDSPFPIIPRLNVLTGPLRSPMRPLSPVVST